MLFYLLRDGKGLRDYLTQFMPTKLKEPVGQVLSDVNQQLSNYVRGQVTVAIIVAVMFIIFFKIIGLQVCGYAGVTAGILNLVPYLGSFLPCFLLSIGRLLDQSCFLKVIIVFIVEQTIEGRFVSPLILGSQLNIHPINVLFVLLTSGSMFGIWESCSVFQFMPLLKLSFQPFFEWYKVVSGLYELEGEEVKSEQ